MTWSKWATFLVALAIPSFAAEEITLLLQNEMKRAQENVKFEIENSRKKLETLRSAMQKAESASKKQAEQEQLGVDLLRDYVALVESRYVSEAGDYDAGTEISGKDQEYINRLFGKYLHSMPLQGRASAGEAIRVLEWGSTRLSDLIKTHGSPSEANNPELEILASQIRETEGLITKNLEVAKKLGIDPKMLEESKRETKNSKDKDDDSKRTPASEDDEEFSD